MRGQLRTSSPRKPQPRVVLVTGASSGIGQAVTERLLQRGDQVAVLSRDGGRLHDVVSSHLDRALTFPGDVADREAVAAAVTAAVDTFGRLDAVIHTAQSMAYGRIEDVPAEVFDRVVDVAMKGTANLARAVLPHFRAQEHGTFVIVNSLLGQIVTPRMGTYDAAKWGQFGLARVLQLEVRDTPGVEVCIVSPGAIDTPIYDQAANFAGRAGHPPAPVVKPDRVANAAIRLLDHPRRLVEVGPANHVIKAGFRFAPPVFDRLVGPMVDLIVFRGPRVGSSNGNVLRPRPDAESATGGWTIWGTRRPERGGDSVSTLSPRRAAALRRRPITGRADDSDVAGARAVAGVRPSDVDERSVVIGSGEADFARAAAVVRRWGIHTGAGQRVSAGHDEVVVDDLVVLRQRRLPVPAPCRVVSTVDDPRSVGYTIATLLGHPERGTESFALTWGADDTVRLTVTAAARPAVGLALAGPVIARFRDRIVDRYLRALLPTGGDSARHADHVVTAGRP